MFSIVILAGGLGTRLWPLSCKKFPKQFLLLTNDKYTMLQLTINRAMKLKPDNIIIVCNKEHDRIVKQQIDNLGIDKQIVYIITEPIPRNTAPAIAVVCKILQSDTILVIPSDHVFDDDLFVNIIKQGIELINEGIVTFGVKPTYAETGYGYIEHNNNNIIKFIEKPNISNTIKYLNDGKHLWNSGVFLFNRNIMIDEFKLYANDIWESVDNYLNNKIFVDNVLNLGEIFFRNLRNISIDYAIMVHHSNGKILLYDGRWNDIGSFKSLHNELPKEDNNNYMDGNIQIIDTNNCYIKSHTVTATIGIENLIVVNTPHCLLVANSDKCQNIRQIVNELEEKQSPHNDIYKVNRPWGWYMNIHGDDYCGYKVKNICVFPDKRLSLQSHKKRSEHWVITEGSANVQIGNEKFLLNKNQYIFIPLGVQHRIGNNSSNNLYFIETQIGSYLGEDDIERYEDDFGRI